MNFNLFKNNSFLITFIFLCGNCSNSPAINDKYDFNSVKYIKIDKISDYLNFPGSGKIMEDNLSFMFMKNGFNVSQTSTNNILISLNEQAINTLKLSCTLTEYTDRETILIPYRIEDKGSIETIITQTTDPGKGATNSITTTSTTTTNDGGSIQETGKLEYTQARVGIIMTVKDEKTGLVVWTHSYWYSGIELSSTAQVCAKNSVKLMKKLFNT